MNGILAIQGGVILKPRLGHKIIEYTQNPDVKTSLHSIC